MKNIEFKKWMNKEDKNKINFFVSKESFGGSAVSPSSAEEQGDGGERLVHKLEKPGAFPTYELPVKRKKKLRN